MIKSRPLPQQPRDGTKKNDVVVHVLSEEPVEDSGDLALTRVFRGLSISQLFFGLIWKRTTVRCMDVHTVHCCVVLACIWTFVLNYFFMYHSKETLNPEFIVKFTAHISAAQVAASLTAFVYFNHKHVPCFLRQWENYKLKHGGLPLKMMKRCVTKRIIVTDVVFVLYFAMTGVVKPLFGGPMSEDFPRKLMPFVELVPTSHPVLRRALEIMWLFVYFYVVFAWMQTVIVATSACALLSKEFELLTQDCSQTITQNSKLGFLATKRRLTGSHQTLLERPKPIVSLYEVERSRLRHLDLARLVARLDKILHVYLLMVYLFNIPLIVILLFAGGTFVNLIFEDLAMYMMGMTGLVLFSVIVTWISYSATTLATAVSSLPLLSRNEKQTLSFAPT